MKMDTLKTYYSKRVQEYESIYHKPERQHDLEHLKQMLRSLSSGQSVLEVACGTGYWTQGMAEAATSIIAVDNVAEVLEVARQKRIDESKVTFVKADAYDLAPLVGSFSMALVAFWWSHIPKEKIPQFLRSLHGPLTHNSLVVLVDNKYVPGSSTPITEWDSSGNTYQTRTLSDGSEYRILKNFPKETELRDSVESYAEDFDYKELDYFWIATYRVAK